METTDSSNSREFIDFIAKTLDGYTEQMVKSFVYKNEKTHKLFFVQFEVSEMTEEASELIRAGTPLFTIPVKGSASTDIRQVDQGSFTPRMQELIIQNWKTQDSSDQKRFHVLFVYKGKGGPVYNWRLLR
jgi:hypothetical protein